MAAPPCKGVKKDGTPCRGNGNEQLDGYCIAHGAPEKTRAWRVLGGENSSTAARADKRIPERFRPVIQAVTNGIAEVREGTLKPAAYAAICRGAKILLELYRAADADMELVRLEEIEAAAAEVSGSHGDLEILDAAAELSAQQERYRLESLAQQGLLSIEPAPPPTNGKTKPSARPVLTAAGRRSFGYRELTGYNKDYLECLKEEISVSDYHEHELLEKIKVLTTMRAGLQAANAALDHPPAPARDALTGLALGQPPSCVDPGAQPVDPGAAPDAAADLKDRLRLVNEIIDDLKDTHAGEFEGLIFKYI